MPTLFDQFGIRFEFPENWSVEVDSGDVASGDTAKAECTQVTVSNASTAFWHLSKHPAETELEPLFDEALSALRAEYRDIDVEPAADHYEQHHFDGFDVSFIYLDLTCTCWLRGLETDEATYLLLCQAEDREFEEVAPVFRAMLVSVLQKLA